jgi:pyruvate-ferredoxin/flavodoxin oxidoreductase
MRHVCGGVIGYPITPSTEIAETYEAFRAEGQINAWGRHPFFVEAEGEHSAQSGALGAALTGGNFISNASSSQGILYALESHFVTAGKKIGGFVLQVAARVVSKHSLNVMAGHDDIYSLLPSGYTILFGSNPQEAADLAAISYKVSALSLIPVANTMDGFATSHVMSEVLLPEAELLRDFLGDPTGRIKCPTVAQEMLFGAKGRVFQLRQFVERNALAFDAEVRNQLDAFLEDNADAVEADAAGTLIAQTQALVPPKLQERWRRQWLNAWEKGTRQLVPALVDPNNPGLTGPVQNQPDFQAGSVDHRTHFVSAVPAIVKQAMDEYSELTGREYQVVQRYGAADADYAFIGLGSITDDARAVLPYLESIGLKVAVVSIKMLQPFPDAELVAAVQGAKSITILERSDDTALTRLTTQALFRASANSQAPNSFPNVGALDGPLPQITTAIFGLGGHDVQPRDMVAAAENMKARAAGAGAPLVYIGSQFFAKNPAPSVKALQDRLRAAYPETELMALQTGENPRLLPAGALRIRFHSVGGYGTVATGKLLTDILAGVLSMHSKSSPKYGSEKSGAPTNYYITLSPEPVLLTNAELEDVDVVVCPDEKAFHHTNPLKGLGSGGTFILQSSQQPHEVWQDLPAFVRAYIKEKQIKFLVVDAFAVAKKHAPTPELQTRMMGIAFIGAIIEHVDQITERAGGDVKELVRHEIAKKFGRKGDAVVESNMAVIRDGGEATSSIEYNSDDFLAFEQAPAVAKRSSALSASMCPAVGEARPSPLFDPAYYEDLAARPFREGTIGESPVLPGAGLFMPVGTGAVKNKGLFRRTVPVFDPAKCTACMECALVCPDAAIPNTAHEIADLLQAAVRAADITDADKAAVGSIIEPWAEEIRKRYSVEKATDTFANTAFAAAAPLEDTELTRCLYAISAQLKVLPVARPRPIFDAFERDEPGTGGLYSVVVDPWKCTGCLQCVEVCGPGALSAVEQDEEIAEQLASCFERLTELPNTPARFTADAIEPGGDTKRIMLDRKYYYSMTGGHGACRGCGEVTATRLVTALSHAIGDEQRKAHIEELEKTISALAQKLSSVTDVARQARIEGAITELDKRLYLYEAGPTGRGPASTVIANSTGCSSVYASTMPFQPYLDPWVNSLFQDAQALAVGIFEGLVSEYTGEVKALRTAELELADAYDPAVHDAPISLVGWRDFTPKELALLPNVLTIGGDGATYDIGFGALSRVLASGTPIKALVLDTGVYSNTGGQASSASYTGQDVDLARFGKGHQGKRELRKELGLIASFHPNVFACATSTALHSHYLETVMSLLGYQDGAGVMVTYTACGTENGVPEDLSNARAQLAVESRLSPVFIHDPRLGESITDRFVLDGNPDVDQLWTSSTLEYVDGQGNLQLLQTPLTPAEFALGEVRFAKQFKKLADDVGAVPISEYVELGLSQREGKIPFVYATDKKRQLIKVACSAAIVALVEDRKHYWQTLQFLAGVAGQQLTAAHAAELAALNARYEEAVAGREESLDEIAAALVELATASPKALEPVVEPAEVDPRDELAAALISLTTSTTPFSGFRFGSEPAATAQTEAVPGQPAAAVAKAGPPPIFLAAADEPKCVDCGTCYQELPQLFAKATIIVDGEAKTVGHLIKGSLEKLTLTPDLQKKINKVKASCDAEIIQ